MLEELNHELLEIKEKMRIQRKLEDMLYRYRNNLKNEKDKLAGLRDDLEKEGADVEKLQGLSLAVLFHTIRGNRQEKLEKEQQELLAAQLKYGECNASVLSIEKEIRELQLEIGRLGNLESRYRQVLEKKEALIMQSDSESTQKLLALTDEMADVNSDIRELQEAINAGNNVLSSLQNVIGALESAEKWGTWDMLGGGFIATAAKHDKLDEARDSVYEVQQNLRRFQNELGDVAMDFGSEIVLELSSFESFADYFFDGFFADWMIQSKIESSMDNALSLKARVRSIVTNLENRIREAQSKINTINNERRGIVERA